MDYTEQFIRLNCSLMSDYKMMKLNADMKCMGLELYLETILFLRKQQEYKHDFNELDLLADQWGATVENLQHLIKDFDLFLITEDGYFRCLYLDEVMGYQSKLSEQRAAAGSKGGRSSKKSTVKASAKATTSTIGRGRINDCLGNPVEIGIAVIWRVTDTAKAVFNVDNYKEYLSLQCDSALRNVVRVYPYDVSPNVDTTGDGVADEGSLRGSSEVVAARIRDEIQKNVAEAGIEVVEARITYLAYAPEIAAVMLQRQQASAIIDARKMIVDGAVGMVEMALDRLNENKVVELDDERKAAMVSNLLVVLCGNRDAQPIVNSGSLY